MSKGGVDDSLVSPMALNQTTQQQKKPNRSPLQIKTNKFSKILEDNKEETKQPLSSRVVSNRDKESEPSSPIVIDISKVGQKGGSKLSDILVPGSLTSRHLPDRILLTNAKSKLAKPK